MQLNLSFIAGQVATSPVSTGAGKKTVTEFTMVYMPKEARPVVYLNVEAYGASSRKISKLLKKDYSIMVAGELDRKSGASGVFLRASNVVCSTNGILFGKNRETIPVMFFMANKFGLG